MCRLGLAGDKFKRLLRGAPFFKWLKKGSPLACRLSIFEKPEFSWQREALFCDALKKGFTLQPFGRFRKSVRTVQ